MCEIGRTPLHYAVGQNHAQVVAQLIAGKADLDLVNGNGRSALIIAAKNRRREIAQLLVLAGANLQVVDRDRMRAADYVKDMRDWAFLVDRTPPRAATI